MGTTLIVDKRNETKKLANRVGGRKKKKLANSREGRNSGGKEVGTIIRIHICILEMR